MSRAFRWYWPVGLLVLGLIAGPVLGQTDNRIGNGDLESGKPGFWDYGEMGGSASWTKDDAHNGEWSLKLDKETTGAAVSLVTVNQANLYWNSMSNVLYDIGGWVKVLAGASASTSTAGQRIGMMFTFKNASDADIVAPVFLAADPSNNDWQELTSQVLLNEAPTNVYCEIMIESNATGHVYFDHFNLGSDPWTAGFFGDGVETPEGWMNWAAEGGGYANADTSTMAHSGEKVAKLIEEDDADDEMVFYSVPYEADPNTDYIVGVYAKSIGVNEDASFYPSGVMTGEGSYINDRANLCFFFHSGDIETSWSLTGGDQFMYLDQTGTDVDWKAYWGLVTSPEDATGLSVRARYNNYNTGTTLYDDFFAYKVTKGENLVENGDLETVEPFFWNEGQTGGTLTWAEDDFYAGMRSLKIEKTTTGTAASWITDNQANTYWNASSNVLYDIGGWIKIASGNTASATEGERIGLLFTFKDASNADIVAPVFIAADPSLTEWQEVTSQVLLSTAPETVTCEAIIESDATGTAWFDSFTYGSDPWTAGFFGDGAETPTGWMNWSAADGGFAEMVEVEGNHVARLTEEDDLDDEMVFYSVPTAVEPNTWYEFTVKVKAETLAVAADSLIASGVLNGDGAFLDSRANLCFFFHSGDIETSWSLTGGDQFVYFDSRVDKSGWVTYRAAAMSPEDATGASLRARFNNYIIGDVLYDDFEIRKLTVEEVIEGISDPSDMGVTGLPSGATLSQNYPNPFNSTTSINFTLPKAGHISLEVFDVLGRRVATLYEGVKTAGAHTVSFNVNGQELNLSTGLYFYRLNTPEGQLMKKMLYLK